LLNARNNSDDQLHRGVKLSGKHSETQNSVKREL